MKTIKIALGVLVVGVITLALSVIPSAAMADQHKDHAAHHAGHGDHAMVGAESLKCSEACSTCARSCNSCVTHCISEVKSGNANHAESLKVCQDCATICSAASEIMARGGPLSDAICKACIASCDECIAVCKKFPNDQHMQSCMKDAQNCKASCEAMLKG